MDSIRCTNCSLLNFATATACKRCAFPFESAAGSEWNSRENARAESYAQTSTGESPYWDQPAYRRDQAPAYKPSGSRAPKFVKIFVALALISLVAFVAIPAFLRYRNPDLSKLSWSDYKSPDGKFSVSMPVVPKQVTMPQQTSLGILQINVLHADVSSDGGCMLLYSDYPVEHLNMSEESFYDLAVKGMARQHKELEIGARRYVTLDGNRGIEVEMKPADSKLATHALGRIFWVSPRLYVIVAGGPDTPEYVAMEKRCLDSFRLLRR